MGLGQYSNVALFDFETIKEVLNREEMQGRMDAFIMRYRTGGENMGITMNEGPDFKLHRKFMMRTLKDLGAGKSTMEYVLIDEADRICNYLEAEVEGRPIEVNQFFNTIALNMVWKMVSGKR